MKKLFLILFLCFFLSLVSPARSFGRNDSIIFSDPGYTQPTHNFSPGQMVYVKVETSGDGEKQKLLRLLNAQKDEIERFTLSRSDNDPFIYTASFSAPEASGVYYVDIKIEREGSSFAYQGNINVNGEHGPTPVLSEAESSLTQESQPTPTITPTLTPLSTIEPEISPKPEINPPLVEKSESFVVQIIEFFRKLFFNLGNRWVLTAWFK